MNGTPLSNFIHYTLVDTFLISTKSWVFKIFHNKLKKLFEWQKTAVNINYIFYLKKKKFPTFPIKQFGLDAK